MRQHDHAGVLLADEADLGCGEALMDLAMSGPRNDLNTGFGSHILRQIFVGKHDHPIDPERFNDLLRIAGRAADI